MVIAIKVCWATSCIPVIVKCFLILCCGQLWTDKDRPLPFLFVHTRVDSFTVHRHDRKAGWQVSEFDPGIKLVLMFTICQTMISGKQWTWSLFEIPCVAHSRAVQVTIDHHRLVTIFSEVFKLQLILRAAQPMESPSGRCFLPPDHIDVCSSILIEHIENNWFVVCVQHLVELTLIVFNGETMAGDLRMTRLVAFWLPIGGVYVSGFDDVTRYSTEPWNTVALAPRVVSQETTNSCNGIG